MYYTQLPTENAVLRSIEEADGLRPDTMDKLKPKNHGELLLIINYRRDPIIDG